MPNDPQLTPMMAQYRRIKSELPADALLLFRLGDFYEMFFEDAQAGSQILNVALTRRGSTPMCGIPFHAANNYIARILRAGRKVAICDQVEDARPGQLVRREVTQIISPGTHFDDRILSAERNNYLAAICAVKKQFGLAALDLTTAEFKLTEVNSETALLSEMERLKPAEVIYPDGDSRLAQLLKGVCPILLPYEGWTFAPETALFTLREHFKVATLDGYGLKSRMAAIGAGGATLHYLQHHLRRDLAHITRVQTYEPSDFLALDSTTLRTLEVIEPALADAPRNSSLYSALNRTVTPMGARKLRDWLTQPLASQERIKARQAAVETWLKQARELEEFRLHLSEVRDLERTLSRLSIGSGNARDLVALRAALERVPGIRGTLREALDKEQQTRESEEIFAETSEAASLLRGLLNELRDFPELAESIGKAIVDEPPLALKEGGMIRDGFDSSLDELRAATREGKDWIAKLQQEEMEQTGITTLKIRFNSVFGYYIEVTKSHLDKVPAHYIRKQTVANGERFITPALKEMEGKILGAEERSIKLEYELFQRVRENVLAQLPGLQGTARALGELDALGSFAETARLYSYCKPEIGNEGILRISEGRHPALEQSLTEERFVPNDVNLDTREQQIAIITGPNMAGKSTYIRQTALLALMAHTGSFIPATKARVDLLDRIFTRIGASDDLARGQSTFMVEMSETANILNNATQKSLIVLDEIGRGTSTFDGLSLAWSIVEYLHHQAGAKTLFATHYHELTELSGRLARVKNFNVAVREWNEQIIFLRKIVAGGTDKSYGIQVARLAGIPKSVVERAKEILSNLEEAELTPAGRKNSGRLREREKLQKLAPPPQLDLFQ
ncbi:MAG: DNA mismatch repair protein MutS [Verrucomicrobiota bacterium]|nr:DNA mismatch repair protein MutS [Verrucomicrobiota bacterium]